VPRNIAWPNESRPPKPSSRLKAHANSAKHSAFITNTGYSHSTQGTTASSSAIATIAHLGSRVDATPREAVAGATAGVVVDGVAFTFYRSRPNNPAGRRISTMTITTKITVFEASG
jgi:hypothetical protein